MYIFRELIKELYKIEFANTKMQIAIPTRRLSLVGEDYILRTRKIVTFLKSPRLERWEKKKKYRNKKRKSIAFCLKSF